MHSSFFITKSPRLTGLVESSMARLRLTEVPKLLVGASVMSVLAVLLGLR